MILRKVRAKNFFNIGNAFMEFDIQKYHTSVIHGSNGSGKSSIVNMITFGLFNQTIKNVTKPQVINSVNGKNCVVEIEFWANGREYLVRRGIKPNIFEIIEDGTPLNQTAVNDFQDMLEKTILQTNFKTFTQTSILSVENYKPFMSMRAWERRQFVEDILDIRVFSFMNQIVKQRISKGKEELKLIDVRLASAKEKATMQKRHIDKLQTIMDQASSDQASKIAETEAYIAEHQAVLNSAQAEATKLSSELLKVTARNKDIQIVQADIVRINAKRANIEANIDELHDTGICPTCKQDARDAPVLNELEEALAALNREHDAELSRIKDAKKVSERLSVISTELAAKEAIINSQMKLISAAQAELKKLQQLQTFKSGEQSSEIANMKAELKEMAKDAMTLRTRQSELRADQDYLDTMVELFKDTGVKSKIVAQYIPVINETINYYLDKMDFFVSFELDENFNESLKSRHRDSFSYDSFSAGEKQRIDLALMFTFRKLAALRNSVQCNMLFLDELMDASMDAKGIELMLKIIDGEEMKKSNIVVISHRNKDVLEEVFDASYQVYREQGFSQIREV